MNKWFLLLPISLFLLGVFFLGYGLFIEEVTIGLAVFIPFIISNGVFGFLGIICLFLSMISLFFILTQLSSIPYSNQSQQRDKGEHSSKKSKIGGVIFLGPIPIVFGSDKKITQSMILVSIIISIIILVSLMLHFY
jgi:uncharacterized protein (TIGR00304 family)